MEMMMMMIVIIVFLVCTCVCVRVTPQVGCHSADLFRTQRRAVLLLPSFQDPQLKYFSLWIILIPRRELDVRLITCRIKNKGARRREVCCQSTDVFSHISFSFFFFGGGVFVETYASVIPVSRIIPHS